jgi:1,2-diacylglycerol 3-alpha-glucosyltransferase
MKIAMFNDNFYPEMSGISDSMIDSAKELAKMGHQIDFYVPKYARKDFKICKAPLGELDLGENIKIHRLSCWHAMAGTGQGRMVIPKFVYWLTMRKNKPDIVHVHLFFGMGWEAVAVSKFLKIPLVGTNHTPITEFLHYSPIGGKFLANLGLKYVSWFYNHCDFVTAPNGAILKEMAKYGFRKQNQVLSNPVDLENFYPAASAEEKEAIKKEFGLSAATVLYTGRLSEEKHVDVLIRALALAKEKIPDINLAITGHGVSEETLKKMAEELGIANAVKFFGTLPLDRHARIYKAADVFAVASTAEMQCLSMMKAMAAGLPVIGVNAWALPEYINDQNGFVLEPGDYQGIAEKIVFLFNNPQQRKILGQGGLETARKFSPEKIAKRWIEIYEKVIIEYNKK